VNRGNPTPNIRYRILDQWQKPTLSLANPSDLGEYSQPGVKVSREEREAPMIQDREPRREGTLDPVNIVSHVELAPLFCPWNVPIRYPYLLGIVSFGLPPGCVRAEVF
jgi:hypothetical protein